MRGADIIPPLAHSRCNCHTATSSGQGSLAAGSCKPMMHETWFVVWLLHVIVELGSTPAFEKAANRPHCSLPGGQVAVALFLLRVN